LTGPPGQPPCPADGEPGGDTVTNTRKNRKDTPTSYHEVMFTALTDLDWPHAAKTDRTNWTAAETAVISPFEGVQIYVVAYIVAVKKQFGGTGEATNCHFSLQNFVDTHVALVSSPGEGEKDAVVVEPTPRFYAQHPSWVFNKLTALDHSADPV